MRKRTPMSVARTKWLARALPGVVVAAAAGIATAGDAEDKPATPAAAHPVVEVATDFGTMTVELRPDRAPRTVANFLALADEGFYDGLVFHRVIQGFMIQAGGFDTDLARRPAPRTVPNESIGGLANERGTIAMARTGDPDSASAQFYINLKDSMHLNGVPGQPGYTVFGRVTAGLDVAERIEAVPTGTIAGMRDVPLEPVAIVTVRRLAAPE